MTPSLSPTLTVPTPIATTRAAAVPCAARLGTSFKHPDGRCQCFVGGPAPQLATPPHPHPPSPLSPPPRSRSRAVTGSTQVTAR